MLKVKKCDIICYKLTSLVLCDKLMTKNPKNRRKLMKIANIDREFNSERLEEIQWNFQGRCVLR